MWRIFKPVDVSENLCCGFFDAIVVYGNSLVMIVFPFIRLPVITAIVRVKGAMFKVAGA